MCLQLRIALSQNLMVLEYEAENSYECLHGWNRAPSKPIETNRTFHRSIPRAIKLKKSCAHLNFN